MRKQLIELLLAVTPCGGCSSYTASQAAWLPSIQSSFTTSFDQMGGGR
jgi:hypothetical protein